MLAADGNASLRDLAGATAYDIAIRSRKSAIAKILNPSGGDPEFTAKEPRTRSP